MRRSSRHRLPNDPKSLRKCAEAEDVVRGVCRLERISETIARCQTMYGASELFSVGSSTGRLAGHSGSAKTPAPFIRTSRDPKKKNTSYGSFDDNFSGSWAPLLPSSYMGLPEKSQSLSGGDHSQAKS